MAELMLVRHAQASLLTADYDALSALGREQARALGRHWAAHGVRYARVYVGPRRRHRETLAEVAAAYATAGLEWPPSEELATLDEHAGIAVLRYALGTLPGDAAAADRPQALGEFNRRYREVMRDWACGALSVPDVEPWAEFRARSLRALDTLCGGRGPCVGFTSGGLVASAAGWLLGLGDAPVIELSAVLRNTALTEVRYTGQRRSLVSFNALPHLPDPRQVTVV